MPTPRTDDFDRRLAMLPARPGVYKYFDKKGNIIYVGKARNLSKRVKSYFTKDTGHDMKTRVLVKKIADFEFTITNSETEALLLENNLIKAHQPRYNIDLKDGKTYPYICIKNERFPRVFKTRKRIEDGSIYFGPYPNFKTMQSLLTFIRDNYKLRTCSLKLSDENIQAGKFRPCLEYHIKKCKAPCVGYQDVSDYDADIEQIKQILRGQYGTVITYLQEAMQEAAEAMNFERAQELKLRLEQIKKHKERATVVSEKLGALEAFGIASNDKYAVVNYFKVERGTIVRAHPFTVKISNEEPDSEVLEAVITKVFAESKDFAEEILTNVPLSENFGLDEKVRLTVPKIGDKRHILDLAIKNATVTLKEKSNISRMKKREENTERVLLRMQRDLRLNHPPKRIECFDNSNLQGTNAVSACVVFEDGKPKKSEYRLFKIRTVEGQDDFEYMKEAVRRRYSRLLKEEKPLPDLLLIDGGKGQLSHAFEVLVELGIQDKLPVIGIAKRLEELFYVNDPVPLYLDKTSPTLKTLQQLRNEAHRFAITFHRKRREKGTLKTSLTDIEGIGEKTAKKLLHEFGSVKRIRNADFDELQAFVGPAKAEKIKAELGGGEAE